MPAIPENASMVPVKFADIELTAPYIFTKGYKLTENEAKFLSRAVVSTVGNYFAGGIRRAGAVPSNPQEVFDNLFTSYELGVSNRGSGTGAVDPVSKAAHSIASLKVKELITAKGLKVSAFHAAKDEHGHSKFSTLVAQYVEKNPWVTELAKSQVAAMDAVSVDADMLEGMDLPEPEETSAAA